MTRERAVVKLQQAGAEPPDCSDKTAIDLFHTAYGCCSRMGCTMTHHHAEDIGIEYKSIGMQ